MEQPPNIPTNERKRLKVAEPTVSPIPKSLSENDTERGNREDHESHQVAEMESEAACRGSADSSNAEILCRKGQDPSLAIKSDEAALELKRAADITDSLHSSYTVVRQYQPSISAQSGATVVFQQFSNSSIGNFNNSIPSTDQGSVKQEDSLQLQNEKITECQQKLRETLKFRFSNLVDWMPTGNKIPLKKVYTKLRIIKGGSGKVNEEHEVRQSETETWTNVTEEDSINCNQLFMPPRGQDLHIRTVITRGVAGIGKTVSVNKFILDWAEANEKTNLDFVFPVPFKDLNLINKEPCSFVELLHDLFPELKGSEISALSKLKMLFIFDGLNESRLSLDFNKSDIVRDVTKKKPIDELLVNVIRGELLPSAFVWITSRPEAFDQIPPTHIDLVIEVQGFNNSQKDEYFRKKIGDQGKAGRVITDVKSCRSLHIMCHMPVFCWMLASVLEKQKDKTPLTLTPMYIHFLTLFVENMKRKLPGTKPDAERVKSDIISLGKLAFEELDKDPPVFYESDLDQNGIKVTEPSVLSGIYTQIFSEELILCQEKMFSFVHLSVQEFFAALYVYLTFNNDNVNVLIEKSSSAASEDLSELTLYKVAVELALQCESGYFDIFLRFLLGLSLESNQRPLKNLIRNKPKQKTKDELIISQKTREEIIEHIKEKFRADPSSDRCRNLRLCLMELGDHSLEEEIQSRLPL